MKPHEDLDMIIILREIEKNRQTGLSYSALHKAVKTYIRSTRTLSKRLKKLGKEGLIDKKVPSQVVRRKRYFITPQGVAYLKRKRRLDLRFDFLLLDDLFKNYEVYRLQDLTNMPYHKNLLLGWNRKENEFKLMRYFKVRPFSFTGLKKQEGRIKKQGLFDFLRKKQPRDENRLSSTLKEFFSEYPALEAKIDPPENVSFALGSAKREIAWDLIPWIAVGDLSADLIEDRIEVEQKVQLTPKGLYVKFPVVYDLTFVRAIFLGVILQKLSLSPKRLGEILSKYMYRVVGGKTASFGCENLRNYDSVCKVLGNRCRHKSNFVGCPRISQGLQKTFAKFKHVLDSLPEPIDD